MSEKTSIASWLRNTRRKTSSVPCGDCCACCKQFGQIDLSPTDDATQYDTDGVSAEGHPVLRRNEDGSCVYLKDERCSIYDRRPKTCRLYDCRLTAVCGLRVQGYDGEWSEIGIIGEQKAKETLTIKTQMDVAILLEIGKAGAWINTHYPGLSADERAGAALNIVGTRLYHGKISTADVTKFKLEQPELYRSVIQRLRARFGMGEE